MTRDRRRIALATLALFALALAVRALHFAAMRDSVLFELLLGDAGPYDLWAQRIAAGDWLGSEVFYQTPLYPYLVGALYGIGGHDPWLVRCLQALFGALSCVCLARAGAGFFGERAGFCAGLAIALYPPAVFFDGILQKASLDLLLTSALLWVMATPRARARHAHAFGAGLLLGALVLNRENAAVLVPVLLAWAIWLGWPRGARRATAAAVLAGLGLCTVLVPVGLRNWHVGGAFVVTTSQLGSNFYIGNHRGADGSYTPMRGGRGEARFERDDARRIAEDALRRPLGPTEVSRYWLARSWDDIRSAPAQWLRLLAWKWFLTWNRVELVDAEAVRAHAAESPVLALLDRVLHFGVLVPLAVAGVWWTRREWRRLWMLHAMALAFAASVTLFYVFARYRYPLVPFAALFAGAGVEGFARLRPWQPGRARRLAVALGIVALVALGSNWPVAQRYDDVAITYYNAGTTLLDAGRVEEALVQLERARQIDPGFPETYNNLGRAWLAIGDDAAARRELERGVELAPEHAILQLNLAVATSRQGDAQRTRTLLERAIALDPLLAPAYGPLAELELRSGDVAQAIGHLQRAIELTPGSAVAHADLALAWLVAGRPVDAVAELRRALRLDPSLVPVRARLAWILATASDPAIRNAGEALALAEELARGASDPERLQTLAAARAANGAFDAAAAVAADAAANARAAGDAAFAARLERQRAEYLAGRALQLSFTAE